MYDESRVPVTTNIIVHVITATVAGGNGRTSNFLTTDGLTKGAGNLFLFTTVKHVDGSTGTLQTDVEAPFMSGWSYNVSTGELITLWMESKNTGILIGGNVEGLETEENGTVCKVMIMGV